MTRTEFLSAARTSNKHQVTERNGSVRIALGFSKNAVAVRMYEDGTLVRDDVSLELASKMTVKAAAKLLDL